MKLTQPVLIQRLEDEYEIDHCGYAPRTPATPRQVLKPADEDTALSLSDQTTYQSGVNKLIHLMKWSRPEILHAVIDLLKQLKRAN